MQANTCSCLLSLVIASCSCVHVHVVPTLSPLGTRSSHTCKSFPLAHPRPLRSIALSSSPFHWRCCSEADTLACSLFPL